MHEFIPTEDGSVTLYVPELKEHYHSVHGAIQESRHIFIRAGLEEYLKEYPGQITASGGLYILEAGFGTGLNAYLTLLYARQQQIPVCYHTLEKYPLSLSEAARLNYPQCLGQPGEDPLFEALHRSSWEQEVKLLPFFRLYKHQTDFRDFALPTQFDLVFFDAFNPEVQPHLWTAEVFRHFYDALKPGGILVTYCVKGIVKQALRSLGFRIERLPGPPGKREMLRAVRPLL